MVFNGDGTAAVAGGNATSAGSDGVGNRDTTQYCCGGSAPMLKIGGTLYGTAGPANGSSYSTNVALGITDLSGTATTDASTAEGSGSAVLTYTITHNSLEYLLIRTVTYTYPNSTFLDEYEIVIPAGNTETVKFYLGGDSAPGSSDSGTGVELTSPVRTIYSVNPSSEIQLGFGEVVGGDPFDGAVIGSFSAPYGTVQAGGDIGFAINTSNHDAGIMIQWTIGADPGSHERSLRHYVGARGSALSATFADAEIEDGETSSLDLEILNTSADDLATGGFTLGLPDGLTVAAAATSSCGGTLTAAVDGTSVVLADGEVTAGSNCEISVPVVADEVGTYEVTSASVSTVIDVENAIGSASLVVNAAATPPEPECVRTLVGNYEADTSTEGIVSRMYMASFNRQPDAGGHAFWVEAIDSGAWSLDAAANFFVTSPEFVDTYGALSQTGFVDTLYNNVMCRDADAGGKAFWLDSMDDGMAQSRVVLHFSESPEFKQLTATS